MKKTGKMPICKLPNGKFCAATCRTCPYYNLSDTDSRGWACCTRLGGYRSPSDYCGYHPKNS